MMPNIKKLGKLYFFFALLLGFFFLLQKVPNAGSLPIDNSIISSMIYSMQSFLENIEVKRTFLTIVILCTLYVAMESLVFLREYIGYLYFKSKKNKVIEE